MGSKLTFCWRRGLPPDRILLRLKIRDIYIDLFDCRQAGDYADFVDFDKEKTLPLIPRTENLLIKIEELIKKI